MQVERGHIDSYDEGRTKAFPMSSRSLISAAMKHKETHINSE